jgi:hypothetical protein
VPAIGSVWTKVSRSREMAGNESPIPLRWLAGSSVNHQVAPVADESVGAKAPEGDWVMQAGRDAGAS